MFPSDLSFSKAIIADRLHRPARPQVERVHRTEADRPGPRQARGR